MGGGGGYNKSFLFAWQYIASVNAWITLLTLTLWCKIDSAFCESNILRKESWVTAGDNRGNHCSYQLDLEICLITNNIDLSLTTAH